MTYPQWEDMKSSTTDQYAADAQLARDIEAARGVKPAQSALDRQEGGQHYKDRAIQPVEYIHANGLGFIEGSIVKYITRWRERGGETDLLKIKHYVDLLIELEGKREINPAPEPKNGAPIHDGWIEWHGGDNPAGNKTVMYKMRDGVTEAYSADALRWEHEGDKWDIIAYRIV